MEPGEQWEAGQHWELGEELELERRKQVLVWVKQQAGVQGKSKNNRRGWRASLRLARILLRGLFTVLGGVASEELGDEPEDVSDVYGATLPLVWRFGCILWGRSGIDIRVKGGTPWNGLWRFSNFFTSSRVIEFPATSLYSLYALAVMFPIRRWGDPLKQFPKECPR
jgi:hypothetical protein